MANAFEKSNSIADAGVYPMHFDLPRLILILAGILIILGVALHGLAWTEFQRLWHDICERPGGSLALRFVLQPAMSSLLAFRDGIKDARTGRPPYSWTLLSDPDERRARLREGAAATGKIILIAVILDCIYQY